MAFCSSVYLDYRPYACAVIALSLLSGCTTVPVTATNTPDTLATATASNDGRINTMSKTVESDSSTISLRLRRHSLRRAAVAGAIRGYTFRVKGAGANAPGPSIAGYQVLEETRWQLTDSMLHQLKALVVADEGFDDSVNRRCRPGTSVGFSLDRIEDEASSALVLDFGCNRLIVDDAESESEFTASYFDPSRAAFVELVMRAFPDDDEIRALNF